ncbi:hypothetical protein BEWA_002490 [Theileria equi strain WA]|uniref:Uncharacterized protein n=1 Tax=Theileria equi strain WA TaxID=1537102 RepID=L0AZ28_THEEQ|nr:hypothetical protein BEWA_002490 [Theileria equi strain WA]AFZ80842.1 hypothetical protein BEWA_002490 [Theileria equi strain WA]|eukprot:XP_004830508.1 hypothetical protein BEWA_002490 [Theileria equi strain WA]
MNYSSYSEQKVTQTTNYTKLKDNSELPTEYLPDNIVIEHENRQISISIYGIPHVSNKTPPKALQAKGEFADKAKRIAFVASRMPTSDYVCLGIGRDDVTLVTCLLRGESEPGTREQDRKIESNTTMALFNHYLPIMGSIISNKIPHVGVGRNGKMKTISMTDALLNNKLEIPQLLYLQLKYRDICSNEKALKEASQLVPGIYRSIVIEEFLYSAWRLHEEIYGLINSGVLKNKQEIKLAVVVDEWVRPGLYKLVEKDFPNLLQKQIPPFRDHINYVDKRSLGKRHLFSAMVLLVPIILGIPTLLTWIVGKFLKFQDVTNIRVTYRELDPSGRIKYQDTSRD